MKNAETNEISRRRFAIAGLSAGASLFATPALLAEGVLPLSGNAQSADLPAIKPGTNTSFAPSMQSNKGG